MNVKLLSNFSAEILFWTILQLWFNDNVWNYYIHQKECGGLTVNENGKYWYIWNIQLNTLYLFLLYSVSILVWRTMNTPSPMFSGINNNNLFLFCLKDTEKMQYFCHFSLYTFLKKRKYLFLNIFCIYLVLFQVKVLYYFIKCFVTTKSI